MRTYSMEAVPTDLDIADDGSFGVLVLRAVSKVAIFDLPLPEDPLEDPFRFVDLGSKIAGVATLTENGESILLHTTTAGDDEDKRRLTMLTKNDDTWDIDSVVDGEKDSRHCRRC